MKYTGGCHCGNVKFEVELTIDSLMSCNCSICSKKGHLLSFTDEKNFKLVKGNDSLTDYQFGKKSIHHYFCKTCGIAPFGRGLKPDGTQMRAVNARCLDNIDLKKFPIVEYDGKSL